MSVPGDSHVNLCVFRPNSSELTVLTSSIIFSMYTRDLALTRKFEADEFVSMYGFSPNGQYIVGIVANNWYVRVWDVSTGKPLYILQGHKDSVRCCAFSADSMFFATGSCDTCLAIWNTTEGVPAFRYLQGHTAQVVGCAFSPDGEFLVSASLDKTAKQWHIRTGTCVKTVQLLDRIGHCAFSRDTTTLATVHEAIKIWDIHAGVCRFTLAGHTSMVDSCVFSSDGIHLATTSYDRTVKIWNTHTGVCVHTLENESSCAWHCDFSPDGSLLATSFNDKTACIWRLPHRIRTHPKVMIMVLVGNRHSRLRLPAELWWWMEDEQFL